MVTTCIALPVFDDPADVARSRAFGCDKRVADLNYTIDLQCGDVCHLALAEPYQISKLIRRIVCRIKKCWAGMKTMISAFSNLVSLVYRPPHDSQVQSDIEARETNSKESVTSQDKAKEVGDRYRESLQRTFGDVHLVDVVMIQIICDQTSK